jgi:hypothetical protein
MIHFVWLHDQASSQNMPNHRLRNPQFSTGMVGWLPWAVLETLSDSLHIILRHVWSSCALACTWTTCFLELPIPLMDALSTWWINSVMSRKLALCCDYQFTPWKLQHTKWLLLYGRHFLTDCVLTEPQWPTKTRRFPLSFGGCHVNTWLMGTQGYAYLKSDESFWIALYFMIKY